MRQKVYRILAADDDPTTRLLMGAALGGGRFEVTVVADGQAALTAFGKQEFDMVLLDVEMPEMDGMAVCAAIRQSQRAETPVILVTGRDDPAFAEQVHALPAELLVKPIDWSRLSGVLSGLLD